MHQQRTGDRQPKTHDRDEEKEQEDDDDDDDEGALSYLVKKSRHGDTIKLIHKSFERLHCDTPSLSVLVQLG
jgi:hypothetical protein